MPTINVRTMRAPESEESCLQISSTLPEQLVPSIPSRALHVKKSNTMQSATESASRSSSQGSRPPTGQSSREITHPGSPTGQSSWSIPKTKGLTPSTVRTRTLSCKISGPSSTIRIRGSFRSRLGWIRMLW